MKITESEILDALRAASAQIANPDDAFSVLELSRAVGWSRPRVQEHLLELKRTGRIELVRVTREALNGRIIPVTAYRFVTPKVAKPRRAA
jgi:hypothetical protein